MDLRLAALVDHPDAIPVLARWHHAEWPGGTLAERLAQVRGTARGSGVPMTIVALDDDQIVGSASLVESDMATHPDLSPWLASVYVAAPHRRQGIGSALARRVVENAAALGIPRLYLFTTDQESLYARLGWRPLSRERYRGDDVVVMEIEPTTRTAGGSDVQGGVPSATRSPGSS